MWRWCIQIIGIIKLAGIEKVFQKKIDNDTFGAHTSEAKVEEDGLQRRQEMEHHQS